MGLMDVLQQYASKAPANGRVATEAHFDEVARGAPPETLGAGVSDAFKSDHTPPFGEMVGQLFGRSDPQQQAGVVNNLLSSLGPGVLSTLGAGILGRLASSNKGIGPQLSPQQAAQLSPAQVQEIAAAAAQHDPSVMDKVGGFYAEHPQLVKTLGSAALAIALAGVANRMRK